MMSISLVTPREAELDAVVAKASESEDELRQLRHYATQRQKEVSDANQSYRGRANSMGSLD